jgi:RHS repeat-associated protein
MRRESSHSGVGCSRLLTTILLLLPIFCMGLSATRAHAAVGGTPGTFAVAPTGAATYTIPIWAPHGPDGLQPNIALTYNSSQGNGYVGVGWSVGGLSSIYRCALTYAQDAAPAAVSLSTTDGYCLDGQRLRLTSGTYGTAGSTYQTEVTHFAQVTAYGSAGNGPAYFIVRTPDGRTLQYGNGGGSQVLANGTSTAWQWMLNKVSDPPGNTMTISYTAATGTVVPNTISWTPTSLGASTYSYTMVFGYGTNVLAPAGYVAGTPVQNPNLLGSITIDYNSGQVKEYVLTYQQSGTSGRDRLTQVQECATSTSNCFSPTTVSYQNGSVGVSTSAIVAESSPITPCSGNGSTARYDFNGDGYPDLLYLQSGTCYVAFGSANGYGTPVSTGLSGTDSLVVGDLHGSGKAGLLANNGGTWYYYTWNGSSFTGVSAGLAYDSTAVRFALADVNGDGLPDLVAFYGTTNISVTTRLNTSSGGTTSFSSSAVTAFTDSSLIWAALIAPDDQTGSLKFFDFNGDGRQDLAVQEVSCGGYYMGACQVEIYTVKALIAQTGGTFSATTLAVLTNQSPVLSTVAFANVNNDACTDAILGNVGIFISACNGNAAATLSPSYPIVAVMDWNGDGLADLIENDSGTLYVQLSTGTGFGTATATSLTYNSDCTYLTVDANGDGLDDLACASQYSGMTGFAYYLHNGTGVPPDLLTSITDGYGNSVSPSYVSLTRSVNTTYFEWNDAQFPYLNYNGPIYLTNQAVFSDPTSASGGTYYQNYYYSGLWLNVQGRGFSPLGDVQKYDSRNGVWDAVGYQRAFPYTGMFGGETRTSNNSSSGLLLSHTVSVADTLTSSTSYQQIYFPYLSGDTVTNYELGSSSTRLVSTTSASYSYDNYGNPTSITKTITDNDANSPYDGQSWTTATTNTPDPDTSTWCLNLFTETQVTYTASTGTPVTRTKQFTPDLTNCRYTQIVTEPSSSTYKVTENLSYDEFGNVSSDSVTGIGMGTASPATRTTSITWYNNTYPTGQFPLTVVDPSGATQQLTYNYEFGVPISSVDPNGDTTSWAYDGFGRKTQENRPDTTYTIWQYNDCATTGGCLIGAHELALVSTNYGGTGTALWNGTIYYDPLQRPLITIKQLLNGIYNRNEMRYDSLGRTAQQAAPCAWSGSTTTSCPYWTVYGYDVLNRVVQIQRPTSASNSNPVYTNVSYQGDTVITTDFDGNQTTRINSAMGLPGRSQDPSGYYVNFSYDAYGSLTAVTDSLSHTLDTATYDYGLKPFKRTAVNIDAGSRSYTYDALGEVTAWSDAKGQSFTANYDALSRMTARYEPDLYSNWVWGASTSAHNWGRLSSTCTGTGTNPTACTAATGYSEAETYDNLGRLTQRAIQIPAIASPTNGTYTYTWQYNATTGLLNTLTYPVSTNSCQLVVQYGYSYGILTSLTDASNATQCGSTGTVFWTANAENDWKQVTQATLGNGVVVNRSFDAVTGLVQSIQAGSGGGTGFQNMAYLFDAVGDLTQRQDNNQSLTENFYYDTRYRLDHSTLNGTLNLQMGYDATGNITSKSDVSNAQWTYDPTHIHQVLTAGSNTYAYDPNGNVLTRNGSGLAWTSYNYPSAISSGSYSGTFYYDQNRQRYFQVVSDSSNTEQTTFVGGQLELTYAAGGATMWRHYVYAGKEPVAIIYRESNGTNFSTYILKDHMGSVVSLLQGTWDRVNESFAPYGYERNAADWSSALPAADQTSIRYLGRRGFTFQTVIGQPGTTNALGLIHMNGRVMDVADGRFLSADPHMTDPGNPQDYNRYSYVRNNPLTFTDPTGFDENPSPCPNPQAACTSDPAPPAFTITVYACDLQCAVNLSYQALTQQALFELTSLGALSPQASSNGAGTQTAATPSTKGSDTQSPQRGSSSSASVGVLPWIAGAAVDLGEVLSSALTGASGVLMLAPTATATQDDDSGEVFYHGTSTFSGGPLDAAAAAANSNNYGSLPGFYLATDPATAVHFAAAAGNDPAVLQYYVNNTALEGLQQAGAVLGPVPGGPTSTMAFPGQQLFVPVTAFPAFNGYLLSGRIILMGTPQ